MRQDWNVMKRYRERVEERLPQVREIAYAWPIIRRNVLTMVGIAIVLALIVLGVLAPVISPYPEHAMGATSSEDKFQPPSFKHLFGTDDLGRDIFSRVLFGIRISFMIGVIVIGLALLIGLPLGVIAGCTGGKLDEVIMRVTDMFLSFPALLLALAISAALGPALVNSMIAIAIAWWPWYTRLARSQAVSVKERPFVEAAVAIGIRRLRIIFHHVLPNCLTPIIVQASMDFGSVILTSASLSFLGLGAQPPEPEWGLMISIGRTYFLTNWWLTTFPGFAILITVLAFNFLGDGLREILDPRARRI